MAVRRQVLIGLLASACAGVAASRAAAEPDPPFTVELPAGFTIRQRFAAQGHAVYDVLKGETAYVVVMVSKGRPYSVIGSAGAILEAPAEAGVRIMKQPRPEGGFDRQYIWNDPQGEGSIMAMAGVVKSDQETADRIAASVKPRQ